MERLVPRYGSNMGGLMNGERRTLAVGADGDGFNRPTFFADNTASRGPDRLSLITTPAAQIAPGEHVKR